MPSSVFFYHIDYFAIWTTVSDMVMACGRFLSSYPRPLHPIFALLVVFEGSTSHSFYCFDTDNPGALSLTVDNVLYH